MDVMTNNGTTMPTAMAIVLLLLSLLCSES